MTESVPSSLLLLLKFVAVSVSAKETCCAMLVMNGTCLKRVTSMPTATFEAERISLSIIIP